MIFRQPTVTEKFEATSIDGREQLPTTINYMWEASTMLSESLRECSATSTQCSHTILSNVRMSWD